MELARFSTGETIPGDRFYKDSEGGMAHGQRSSEEWVGGLQSPRTVRNQVLWITVITSQYQSLLTKPRLSVEFAIIWH
jgi:hypothetical protein